MRKKTFPDILNKNNFKSINPVNNEILSVVQTGESYSASIDADEFLSRYEEVTKEIQQIIEKNPNYINQDLLAKLRSCVKTKEEQHIINTYLTNRSAYSMHIQHDSVGFVKYALLDSRFRHKDIQVFMSSGRRYYKLA